MITGPTETVRRARKLRADMSLPESILWRALRQRPGGFKFRRQHPASVYVLDFYCAASRLDIEVDGWGHNTGSVMDRDERRSRFLRSQGVATLRVPAKVVLEDVGRAVSRIVEVCEVRAVRFRSPPVPLHHPADGPPPPLGED